MQRLGATGTARAIESVWMHAATRRYRYGACDRVCLDACRDSALQVRRVLIARVLEDDSARDQGAAAHGTGALSPRAR